MTVVSYELCNATSSGDPTWCSGAGKSLTDVHSDFPGSRYFTDTVQLYVEASTTRTAITQTYSYDTRTDIALIRNNSYIRAFVDTTGAYSNCLYQTTTPVRSARAVAVGGRSRR